MDIYSKELYSIIYNDHFLVEIVIIVILLVISYFLFLHEKLVYFLNKKWERIDYINSSHMVLMLILMVVGEINEYIVGIYGVLLIFVNYFFNKSIKKFNKIISIFVFVSYLYFNYCENREQLLYDSRNSML